jgi:hypothetical protein
VVQETQADKHLEDVPEPETVNVERQPSIMPERGGLALDRVDETVVWNVLGTLCRLDIANMTPVQALVLLNELQAILMARKLGAALRIDPDGEHPL